MTDRYDEAWRAYAELDQTLHAPPHLEARVLRAVKQAQFATPSARRSAPLPWLVAAATMAIGVAMAMRGNTTAPAVAPLSARAHTAVLLPSTVNPVKPQLHPGLPRVTPATAVIPEDWLAREDEMRIILMLFDATPALRGEPLQLVRLRLPREALQGLGVALLEPDAGGMVDLDVLVGEDGLPRDIRKVRQLQEEQ